MSATILQQPVLTTLAQTGRSFICLIGSMAVGSALAYNDGDLELKKVLYFLVVNFLVLLTFIVLKNNQGSPGRGANRIEGSPQPVSFLARLISVTLSLRTVPLLFALLLMGVLAAIINNLLVVTPILLVLTIVTGFSGKRPLMLNGLGEVVCFLYGGLVTVCWLYYVQTGGVTAGTVLASLPPGLLIGSILIIENLRNFDRNKRDGNRSLIVRIGRYNGIVCFKVMIIASYLIPFILALSGMAGAFVLLPLCTIPIARTLTIKVECDLNPNLDELLMRTCRLCAIFSLMLAFGIVYHF